MRSLSFECLIDWILDEFARHQSIFGIHRSLFWQPGKDATSLRRNIFGQILAAPIGPAAGPHTQLTQNIVSAWLCGGRFIELKTVQLKDDLEIPRPCIDMEDEGYNVEWSQELRLEQSAQEYIKAWALICVLPRLLDFESPCHPGAVFNTSVGYDLEGIKSAPLTRFLDRMRDASEDLAGIRAALRARYPAFAGIEIPSEISNNVTLSTMHGCPPHEIEKIASYLLRERRLHTTIKLNPTLLGKDKILGILHDDLGYQGIGVPDAVFQHDLQFEQAVTLIKSLKRIATDCGLEFAVKLSNTLPVLNHKALLPGTEMYMSGRALYPLTVRLFQDLTREFKGDLKVSYSGGADALNVTGLLASGAQTVTVASDLLKPGGYARLTQYLERLEAEMSARGLSSIDELAQNGQTDLERTAAEAVADRRYKKVYLTGSLPKVKSGLGLFDCIEAPCEAQCAVRQDVPEYAWLIARGDYDRALEVILSRNPLPAVTGYVCTHLCQSCCTRSASNYDEPVAIRALKRFAVEKGRVRLPAPVRNGRRVAIIGAGPSGLAAAWFLALNGFRPTIFEAGDEAGGMMRLAPSFRLPQTIIREDLDRIARTGADIRFSHAIGQPPEELLEQGFDAVYIATGFQLDAPIHIEGGDGAGILGALDFLRRVRCGQLVELGPRVLVIGGGDTALDAARVARRLTAGPVTVVYRRTRGEMPASEEDKLGAFEEGVHLEELASPMRIALHQGRVAGLDCIRNRPGEPDADGRRRPVPIPGSEFRLEADSVIVAVGQRPDLTFLNGSKVHVRKAGLIAIDPETGRAGAPRVYAGGDAVSGPASIIAACAHGRRAAEAICAEFGVRFASIPGDVEQLSEEEIVHVKRARARKQPRQEPERTPPHRRIGFELIEATLTEEEARREAARCLQCATLCDKCVEVCPNRANHTYRISPVTLRLPVLACRNGSLTITGETTFQVKQARQIIHLPELCNECGNCATFCIHDGRPFLEKPRLYLNADEFEKQSDNAFRLERSDAGGAILTRRKSGRTSELELSGNGMISFVNHLAKVIFSSPDFRIASMMLIQPFPGEQRLSDAAEMYVIAEGLTDCMPWLSSPNACVGTR